MATTETRSGFRLPWSTDHRSTDVTDAAGTAAALEASDAGADAAIGAAGEASIAAPTGEGDARAETPAQAHPDTQGDAGTPDPVTASGSPTPEPEIAGAPMLETSAAPVTPRQAASPAKRPTKFLADLTAAMRAAAESERAEILERFRAEAKGFVEQIHERSGVDATDLRKQTDDDIAGIREWSKAEIARIREETDERIAHRRSRLDRDLEAQAARIEREIERVNATVDGFETQMTRFFEGLLNEDDPTSFAERAANLPEPPSLDDVIGSPDLPSATTATVLADTVPVHTDDPWAAEATATLEATADAAAPVVDGDQSSDTWDARAASEAAPTAIGEPDVDTPVAPDATADAAATMAQPFAETPADVAGWGTEAEVGADTETLAHAETVADAETVDPRVAALGLSPDFAAAEAEASQGVEGDGSDDAVAEEIPELDDETIAARLAGLPQAGADAGGETVSTQVIVTGLVSVASIAGFKRHLGRLQGVRSVGVSSGPEGEFMFSVTHGTDVALHDAIPTLPGFAARVTGSGDGVLHVAARDPETDA